MNKLTVMLLCATLCLSGIVAAKVSAEQTGPSPADPVCISATSTGRVVTFTPSQSSRVLLTLLADPSVDVIELDGIYHLPYLIINVDRARPVTVRPAAGATAIFSGAMIGRDPQFSFGVGGVAGNITMQGLIFDGFVLGQQGIVYALDCHDMTLDDMVVRNCRADARYAQPYHAWALYLSSTATAHVTNFRADGWIIDGSNRRMSALQIYGGAHISVNRWSVANAYYAIFASSTRGPLTDFVLDDWTISSTGSSEDVAVYIENATGRFSNVRATATGFFINIGRPKLEDGGGNSLLVLRMGGTYSLTRQSY